MPRSPVPVIDIFAGPGGLGEGFSAATRPDGRPAFQIRLSIEKDDTAHRTLALRAFFRQHPRDEAPDDYYEHLRGRLTRDELFRRHAKPSDHAHREAWQAELGAVDPGLLRSRIRDALSGADDWVLIGGPPCQAYSLVGRSRNRGIENYSLETDHRATLYRQYLRIIADFWPAAFVMENVRGLLSSKLDGHSVFDRICEDLQDPSASVHPRPKGRTHNYSLHALTTDSLFVSSSDFLIHCERYGIPQARHRVIIVGIRDDVDHTPLGQLTSVPGPTVHDAIRDLPPLRSGLSKEPDSSNLWTEALLELTARDRLQEFEGSRIREFLRGLSHTRKELTALGRGGEFCEGGPCIQYERGWFVDPRLRGFCNHRTRTHIRPDLHRYLFAAAFATVHKHSPHLGDFPESLLPDHRNILRDARLSHFADRFRVQVADRASTTVTSHIGKDGHYYIHYDPKQCRSLTVREAARLQTFPDNYFFCGPRTQQYGQVGNAVPPLLALQIANAVLPVIG